MTSLPRDSDAPRLGANTLHPLEISDARDAAFRASELQRQVEDDLRRDSRALADAEREYRKALATKIITLRDAGNAITACETIAKGDEHVADLRHARDLAAGVWEATRQQAFRRGADRRAVEELLVWSRARDLRAGPVEPATPPRTFGRAAA